MVRTPHALTSAIAAPGASGLAAGQPRDHGEEQSGHEAEHERSVGRERERPAYGEQGCAERDADQGAADEHVTGQPVYERATARSRHDSGEEDEPGRDPGGRGADALALEERHRPVSGDHREPEGRGLEEPEREEASIADEPRPA